MSKAAGTQKSFSIKYRVLAYVCALLLPLIIVIGAAAIVRIQNDREQLILSERMNLRLVAQALEQELMEIESFLYDFIVNSPLPRSLAKSREPMPLYTGAYDAYHAIDALYNTHKDLTFTLLYSEPNDYYLSKDNGLSYLPVQKKAALRRDMERWFIRSFYKQEFRMDEWFSAFVENTRILCRVVESSGVYCVCVMDLDRLSQKLEARYGIGGSLMFRAPGEPLTHAPGGGFITISEPVRGSSISYMLPASGLGRRNWPSLLLIGIAIVSAASLPLVYRNLNKSFFIPLDNLVKTMDTISEGGAGTEADDRYSSEEFRRVNRTFNLMVARIRTLRIEQYEKELEARQSNLRFLQAQIRPHFYLNCLKTLYSLSEQKNYRDIGRCILLISNHLRYAFGQTADRVPLSEEISLCDNYVQLCGILSNIQCGLAIDVDSESLRALIPPVSLLTFVENSVRFGLDPRKGLVITISARKLRTEEGDMLGITVADNGPGFTAEQLAVFNSGGWYKTPTEHVGIQNVIRRFRLIYGEKFAFTFSSKNGAIQELYIPIDQAGAGHETSGC